MEKRATSGGVFRRRRRLRIVAIEGFRTQVWGFSLLGFYLSNYFPFFIPFSFSFFHFFTLFVFHSLLFFLESIQELSKILFLFHSPLFS